MSLNLQINFTILNQIYQNLKKEEFKFADYFYYNNNKKRTLKNLKKKNETDERQDNDSITSITENQYTYIIKGKNVNLKKDTKSILDPCNFNNINFFIAPKLTKIKLKNCNHPQKIYFSDEDWKQFFADRMKQSNKKIFSRSAGDSPITCDIFDELEHLNSDHIKSQYSNNDIKWIFNFFKDGPQNRKIYDDCQKIFGSIKSFYNNYSSEELTLLCKQYPGFTEKYKNFLGGFYHSLSAAQFENIEKKK